MEIPVSSPKDNNFLLEEYKVLRTEMVERIKILFQIHLASLTAVGVIIGAGITAKEPAIIFMYPLVGFFLGWQTWLAQGLL